MNKSPEKQELLQRIESLHQILTAQKGGFDAAFFVNKINQFYLTDTMQNGIFVIKKDGSYGYFVKSSYELARIQSPLSNIFPMTSYKDLLKFIGSNLKKAYIETNTMTLTMMDRLKRYIQIEEVASVDPLIARLRAVKSPYELSIMEESGRQHKYLLESVIPGILNEGMSETEFISSIYKSMMDLGYQGIARFAMFQTEIIVGQIGFGISSIYPTCFDGAGGNRGTCNAIPALGSRDIRLKNGDLVFVDIAYGVNGYHTDRTQLYMFGREPGEEILKIHRACVDIQKKAASLLKPGNLPSEIYNIATADIDRTLLSNFMGFENRTVSFLGHGIGLQVDEFPVIANGFDEPLEENMTIAIEPKNGYAGVGLLGGEDTYVVSKDGGRLITGGENGILIVK